MRKYLQVFHRKPPWCLTDKNQGTVEVEAENFKFINRFKCIYFLLTCVVTLCVVGCTSLSLELPAGMQQLPSLGQKAVVSMSSQNKAKSPLTHSPSHSFNTWPWPLWPTGFWDCFFVGGGFVYFCGGFVFDLRGSAWTCRKRESTVENEMC